MLCVLFRKADYERIAGGEITVAFRRWRRPAVRELRARLSRLDRHHGPWTERVLALIERRPATRAADLAEELGWERQPFKLAVRKLKNLGLTESLAVGYRLSPRGRALLDHLTPAAGSSRRARPAARPRDRRSPPA